MAVDLAVARRLFTREEYHRMAEVGILRPTERVELIRDVALLIEVAESSLRYDQSTKLAIYAESGVPESWVVNCITETIERYRTPEGDRDRDVTQFEAPATLALDAFPDVVLTLAEIFA